MLEFLNNLWGLGKPGGIGSLESILGLLQSLKIRALGAQIPLKPLPSQSRLLIGQGPLSTTS